MANFRADIIVIAGTIDAKELIAELCQLDLKLAVTVTTKYGSELIDDHPQIHRVQRLLTAEGIVRLIRKHEALCVIDASHPFAVEVSQNAMAACKKEDISYIRYAREETLYTDTHVKLVASYEEAALAVSSLDCNVLLTIGSRNLEPFLKHMKEYEERLFVRVLPDSQVLARCERIGLAASNLIAIKGPLSLAMNIELLKHTNAKILIIRDTGVVSDIEDKITAAVTLGARVIMINRPKLNYPQQAKTIGELLYRLGQHIEKIS